MDSTLLLEPRKCLSILTSLHIYRLARRNSKLSMSGASEAWRLSVVQAQFCSSLSIALALTAVM